nr:hypothetical protein KPHV_22590 [Kitasatospora purpeofusca]
MSKGRADCPTDHRSRITQPEIVEHRQRRRDIMLTVCYGVLQNAQRAPVGNAGRARSHPSPIT